MANVKSQIKKGANGFLMSSLKTNICFQQTGLIKIPHVCARLHGNK